MNAYNDQYPSAAEYQLAERIERVLAMASVSLRDWAEQRIDLTSRPAGLTATEWCTLRDRSIWAECSVEMAADHLAHLLGYGPRDGAR